MATFAEYAMGSETNLIKIPQDTPVDRAALLGCGVIAGYGAVVNRAQVKPNHSVIVIGAGGVGLNAIQGAAFVGAFPITAIDTNDKKLEMARQFGATYTINPKHECRTAHRRKVRVDLGHIRALPSPAFTPRSHVSLLCDIPLDTSIALVVFCFTLFVLQDERWCVWTIPRLPSLALT